MIQKSPINVHTWQQANFVHSTMQQTNITDVHVEVGRAVQLYECLHSQLNSFKQEAKYHTFITLVGGLQWRGGTILHSVWYNLRTVPCCCNI